LFNAHYLQVEKDLTSNIKTADNAVWWAYVFITTVGYVTVDEKIESE